MQWTEIGEAQAYLLRHRSVESNPGRRRHPNEEHIADILMQLQGGDGMHTMRQILEGQGLDLLHYEDADMPGIAAGGHVWLLIRHPEHDPPQYFSREYTLERMGTREGDTKAVAGVWFLHIWLMYLSVIYSDLSRGISEASRYQEARFPRSRLVGAVREHCDRLRSSRNSDENQSSVIGILTDTQGADIDRRVRVFCELMCEAGLTEIVEKDGDEPIYRQTLLGAVEVQRNYSSGVGILDPGEDALAQITNIATYRPDAYDDNEMEDEEEQPCTD